MDSFRVRHSGMPMHHGSEEIDKPCSTFSEVLLNEVPGQLVLAQDALLWKRVLGESNPHEDTAEPQDFKFPLDALEDEVLLTAADVDDVTLFGVKLFLSNCDEEVNFLFQETQGETSKEKSQHCFRLLQSMLEAQPPMPRKSVSQVGQGENNPLLGNSQTIPDLSRDAGKRKKRKDRRKSLSLDAFHPLLAAPEEDESEQTNLTGSLSSSELTTAGCERSEEDGKARDLDVVSLARRLARCSSPEEYGNIASLVLETHGYEVCAIRTPTKAQLELSPPRNRQPKKKEIVKLKPIVLEMTKSAKAEREMLQEKTRVRIVSPKTRKGSIQYYDTASNKRVPVEEYASRYYESILGRENIGSPGESESENVQPEDIPCREDVRESYPQVSTEPQQEDYSNAEQVKTCCVHFRMQIEQAEREMNHTFDKALEEFRQAKARLAQQLKDDLRKLKVDETRITSIFLKEDEAFYAGVEEPQVKAHKSSRRRKDDKKNRRKSVCLEHMEGLLKEHSTQSLDDKNRVIWKAN